MDRRQGSGQPRIFSTEENMDLIEELVCSQKERPHTHLAPRKLAEQRRISRSSIRRMVEKRNLKQFKRLKTSQMSKETRNKKNHTAQERVTFFDIPGNFVVFVV